jgi:hypothetical protein
MIWKNTRSVGSTSLFSCYCAQSPPLSVALSLQRLAQNRHLSFLIESQHRTSGMKGDWGQ